MAYARHGTGLRLRLFARTFFCGDGTDGSRWTDGGVKIRHLAQAVKGCEYPAGLEEDKQWSVPASSMGRAEPVECWTMGKQALRGLECGLGRPPGGISRAILT